MDVRGVMRRRGRGEDAGDLRAEHLRAPGSLLVRDGLDVAVHVLHVLTRELGVHLVRGVGVRVVHGGHSGVLERNLAGALDDHRRVRAVGSRTGKDGLKLETGALRNAVREGVDLAGLGKRQVLGEGGAHVVHGVVVHTALDGTGVVVIAVIVVAIVTISSLLLDGAGAEDFDLTAEDHLERLAADGLVDAGKTRAVAPFVEFTTEGVRLELEETELTCGEETVPAGGVDVGD